MQQQQEGGAAAAQQAAEDTGTQHLVHALLDAAERGDVSALQQLLSQGAPVSASHGSLQRTALHVAAGWGRLEAVQVLVAHGATVDAQDAEGLSPLETAVESRRKDVVDVLLDAGAAVDGKGPCGCLYLAVVFAAHTGIAPLLLRRGADPNRRIGDTSLLAICVSESTPEIVEMLLQAGAVGRQVSGCGFCDALSRACTENRPDMVRLVLQHTKQHTPQGLRGLLRWAFAQQNQSTAAQLLLQLEMQQHSAADTISSGMVGAHEHNPSALRMAVLKGWASDTAAVDAGHMAAAAQEAEVAEQRAGLCELAVGFGAAAARCAMEERV